MEQKERILELIKDGKTVLKFSKEQYKKWGVKDGRLRVPNNEPLTEYNVKVRVLCNRAGMTGEYAVFVANETLDKDDFKYMTIKAFAGNKKLHLYFVKQRGKLPEGLNRHWFENVLFPFVMEIKELFKYQGEPSACFSDGEYCRMFQAMRDDFDANNLRMGKIPASTTGELQPLDTSSVFRFLKKTKLGISNEAMRVQSSGFQKVLDNAFKEDEWILENVTKGHCNELVNGLPVLKVVIESQISATVVIDGWRLSGWDGSCEGGAETMFEEMLYYCWKKIDDDDRKLTLSCSGELLEIFDKKGLIEESDYDKLGLFMDAPLLNRKRNHDKWTLSRQRAVNLLHPCVLKRFRAKGYESTAFDTDDADTTIKEGHETEVVVESSEPPKKRSRRLTNVQKVHKGISTTGTALLGLAKDLLNW